MATDGQLQSRPRPVSTGVATTTSFGRRVSDPSDEPSPHEPRKKLAQAALDLELDQHCFSSIDREVLSNAVACAGAAMADPLMSLVRAQAGQSSQHHCMGKVPPSSAAPGQTQGQSPPAASHTVMLADSAGNMHTLSSMKHTLNCVMCSATGSISQSSRGSMRRQRSVCVATIQGVCALLATGRWIVFAAVGLPWAAGYRAWHRS
jgi:hypothetical protein